MVYLNRSRKYPASLMELAVVQRLQREVDVLESLRAAVVRVWSILLVMGENKAKHRRSR